MREGPASVRGHVLVTVSAQDVWAASRDGWSRVRDNDQPRCDSFGEGQAVMNRRVFLSKTAAATAGLALAFPKRSCAYARPIEMVNVAIIGIRGDNKGHPTWTNRGRGQDHYRRLDGIANQRIRT
jgi:hypothetical protein